MIHVTGVIPRDTHIGVTRDIAFPSQQNSIPYTYAWIHLDSMVNGKQQQCYDSFLMLPKFLISFYSFLQPIAIETLQCCRDLSKNSHKYISTSIVG